MSAIVPNVAPFSLCFQWQSRSGIAGRPFPADQAGHRPAADDLVAQLDFTLSQQLFGVANAEPEPDSEAN
jgi:hypothetical protein